MGQNMSSRHAEKTGKTGPRCPICRENVVREFRPFCSKRCANIDLGRWLNGSYAIAGHDDDDEDGVGASGLSSGPLDDEPY